MGETVMFADIPILRVVVVFLDIFLVALVIYNLILVIRGTKAVQLVKGITIILVVWFLSRQLGFTTLGWIMQQAVTYGVLAVLIIFQPELRRALEQLGRGNLFTKSTVEEKEAMKTNIGHIVKAAKYMGKRRIGALITLERETGMTDYVETGTGMNAKLTSELLINIFIPNTPLHDGAVIIKNSEILAAGCYLPLSENPFISKELGTRHRAALGISEVTDSLTIVVSEETGTISLTKNGEIHRNLDEESLTEALENELINKDQENSTSRWTWGGKKNG